jgi:sugar (pentulose or hexulose) kinase
MPDTAGPADDHVVGVDFGTLSGRAVVVRDRRGTGTGGAVLTGTPGTGPITPWREGRDR